MPHVVNSKLDDEVDGYNKGEHQRPRPTEQVDSHEEAGEKAVDQRSGDYRPVPVPEMVDG